MEELAYVNGKITPLAEATVSALDRGFLFGDAVYEVVLIEDGYMWAFDRHVDRLRRSLKEVGMDPSAADKSAEATKDLFARAGSGRGMVYIQVTRGIMPKRGHVWEDDIEPSIVIFITPLPDFAAPMRETGIPVMTYEDRRWGRCDIKTTMLMPNCMGKKEAKGKGFSEILFVSDGKVVEGGATGAMMVKDGEGYIPPLSPELLPSITREIALECLDELGVTVHHVSRTVEEFKAADEVIMLGTTLEIMPVSRIDETDIPAVGPVATKLWDAYAKRMREHKD